MTVCEACGEHVEPGALRCRGCDAPFAGPQRRRRLAPRVRYTPDEEALAGPGLSFGLEEDEPEA